MRIVVVGAGDIGFQLAKRLSVDKHDITMIEADPQKVQRATEQLDAMVLEGNGASFKTLTEAGVGTADVLAAMTDREEVNILACKLGKRAGVATSICRVRNPEFLDPDFVLSPKELGVDVMIHPEKETADAIVRLLRQTSATDVIEFEGGKIELLGLRLSADSPLLGQSLIELGQRADNPPMRIVAIVRNQETLIPRGDDQIIAGDQIFVIADPKYIPTFVEHVGKPGRRIENIMILGGGLVGQFIASAVDKDMKVKIIESSGERSEDIAERLSRTLVIHGDGTDYDLLAAEGIVDMDAFIATTGDDENNIIATLVVRHMKIPRTIALVNKVEYLPITTAIGMDAVVSKQLLTVNAVQRHILYQQVAAIASLPAIGATCIEYIASPESRITKKPLRKIHFPDNGIVGAIIHDEQFIVPTGDTHIQTGDRVIVFALPGVLDSIEKLFS